MLGKKGSNNLIRLFEGGKKEASQIFNKLTKNGEIYFKDTEKIIYKFSDNTYVTYRPISKSGPPTIDIKMDGLEKNIKLKFLEE